MMDLYEHRNKDGILLFHLVHQTVQDELGTEKKKLVSSIPEPLMKVSNEKVFGLFKLESKRIETDKNIEFYQALAESIANNPLSQQFYYPTSILSADGSLSARNLHDIVKWIDDLNLIPGDFFSESIHPMKHFVLCSKFYECRDFQFRDFVREIRILSRSNFERGLTSLEQWKEYKKYIGKKGLSYLTTKTKRGYDCNILFIDGKPVLEYII